MAQASRGPGPCAPKRSPYTGRAPRAMGRSHGRRSRSAGRPSVGEGRSAPASSRSSSSAHNTLAHCHDEIVLRDGDRHLLGDIGPWHAVSDVGAGLIHDRRAVLHLDRVVAYARTVGIEVRLSSLDVELPAMPWAYEERAREVYTNVARPIGLNQTEELASTEWAANIGTAIEQTMEFAVHIEDSNFTTTDVDDQATADRNVLHARDDILTPRSLLTGNRWVPCHPASI